MKALLRTVVLILAGVALLAAAAGAATFTKSPSTVQIFSGNGYDFKIKVTSPKKACIKSRKVELDREGMKVGAGTTDASGMADLPGSYVAGNYTSSVKPNARCKGAKSKSKHY
jgi:hypothetical protein